MLTLTESQRQVEVLNTLITMKERNFPKRIEEFYERMKANEVRKWDTERVGVAQYEYEAAMEIREAINIYYKEVNINEQTAMNNFFDRMDYGMRYSFEKEAKHAKTAYYMKMSYLVRGGIAIE